MGLMGKDVFEIDLFPARAGVNLLRLPQASARPRFWACDL